SLMPCRRANCARWFGRSSSGISRPDRWQRFAQRRNLSATCCGCGQGTGTKMSRAPSTFRQQDVTRAVKAVTAAGVRIARVEIDKTGKIVIITADPTNQPDETTGANEWDRV